MDLRQIKRIMKEFEESSIYKIEITENDFTIKLEKRPVKETVSYLPKEPTGVVEQAAPVMVEEKKANEYIEVKAPLVGTYYESPSPDSKPFVSVNDTVKKGDTLFIIEAMKVMNEIKAPVSGTVVSVLGQNGDMVEFGQVLVEIKE